MSRYDSVQYKHNASQVQAIFKSAFDAMDSSVENLLRSPRAKALVYQKLEEAYMWIGKAIRDDQSETPDRSELVEERTHS